MMIVLGIDVGNVDGGINAAVCSIYDGNGNKIADLCQGCTEAILQSLGCAEKEDLHVRCLRAKAELAELQLERMQGKHIENEEE